MSSRPSSCKRQETASSTEGDARGSPATGLWTISPDGRGLHHVTAAGGDPAYSPDGHWLAFVWLRNGNQKLYKVRTTGTGLVQVTNTYGITEAAPAWQRAR